MKLLLVVLCIISISRFNSALQINPIDGVAGPILLTKLDYESNLYVVTQNALYKLDSGKNVVWNKDINDPIEKLLVTKQNHVYLIWTIDTDDNRRNSITLIKAGTEDFVEIGETYNNEKVFLDDGETLIYNDPDSNIKLLKNGETVPVTLPNMTPFQLGNEHIADLNGNIYFTGYEEPDSLAIYVLTKEALQEPIPEAVRVPKIIIGVWPENFYALAVDPQNNLLISKSNVLYYGEILKLNNDGSLDYLANNLDDKAMKIIPTKDRSIFVFGVAKCSISYLNQDDQFVPVTNLQNVYRCSYLQCAPDDEGNVYISGLAIIGNSSLELLKPEATESVSVSIEGEDPVVIQHLLLDKNNDLWLTLEDGSLHRVVKGSMEAEKVSEAEEIQVTGLNENQIGDASEIILETNDGLFVLSN